MDGYWWSQQGLHSAVGMKAAPLLDQPRKPVILKSRFMLPFNSFRINTCKSVSKQRTLTTFKMNTYANRGGG